MFGIMYITLSKDKHMNKHDVIALAALGSAAVIGTAAVGPGVVEGVAQAIEDRNARNEQPERTPETVPEIVTETVTEATEKPKSSVSVLDVAGVVAVVAAITHKDWAD